MGENWDPKIGTGRANCTPGVEIPYCTLKTHTNWGFIPGRSILHYSITLIQTETGRQIQGILFAVRVIRGKEQKRTKKKREIETQERRTPPPSPQVPEMMFGGKTCQSTHEHNASLYANKRSPVKKGRNRTRGKKSRERKRR